MDSYTPQNIIKALGLTPHPMEGGYFVETWRSEEAVAAEALPGRYGGSRNLGTAIYFLLTHDTFSEMHRLPSDEVFHHYLGDAVEMLLLEPGGEGRVVQLGKGIAQGERPQVVVPKGVWQGSRLRQPHGFALLGCTVAPGFDFEDYERADQDVLVREFPEQKEKILALTHPPEPAGPSH